jgi:RNA ligase (TIGR02306 family)
MSDFAVEVVLIDDVAPHPGADRLDLARVRGWNIVVAKGQFKKHDLAVFFPIDSVLPPALEELLFSDSKIKPKNGRIRTCKIRGMVSQGLLASLDGVGLAPREISGMPGYVLTEALGVVKYEPSEAVCFVGRQVKKRDLNPHFHEYRDIPRLKNIPHAFKEGDLVTVTEKIHGTNFRAGWVEYVPRTLWQKAKAWFCYAPLYEFVYGSRRVQLQDKRSWDGFYDSNVYARTVEKYGLRALPFGTVVYGEVYGDGIQKGYSYGCEAGEHKLVLFDIEVDGVELPQADFRRAAEGLGLPTAPMLFEGPYVPESVMQLARGASVLSPSQKVREGVVCRGSVAGQVVKIINEDYELLQVKQDGTDFH